MPIEINGFHHAGFMITNVERSAEFYEGFLGLKRLPRPDLAFPGMWYDLGNGQQLHLLQTDEMNVSNSPYGYDTHIALSVPDTEAVKRELDKQGIEYGMGNGRAGTVQIFLRDPDGNMIELR
ncbi:MAG TPA: VOC family protein [Blastocatellia bacterium]|nr:VOC family protein [Blastocatellia bacterium]